MKIVFCDDDESYTKKVIHELGVIERREGKSDHFLSFSSGNAFLDEMISFRKEPVDVLFLDVEMEGRSGLVLKAILRTADEVKRIIFLTAHEEVMPMAFGVKVAGFLTKKVSLEEIYQCINRMRDELEADQFIPIIMGREKTGFYVSDLLYIEAARERCRFVLKKDDKIIETRGKISSWEKSLKNLNVIRSHRGFLVNLNEIERVSADTVFLSGERGTIPVGREYRRSFREAYFAHRIMLAEKRMR